MDKFYSAERNVQILVALLKAHGIRYVIASPGTTNINFVASVQCDPFFKVFSSVDERSAAYLACGIASESGEAVVLTCTGATASRNYISGLTEAHYRKLPVLAVTSTQNPIKVGHLVPQVIDRSVQQADTVVESILLNMVRSKDEEWDCEIKVNKALLALRRHGGGPVHINLETGYNQDFSLQELPPARLIPRIMPHDDFPELPSNGKIGIFVGAHQPFGKELTQAVDDFCAAHDAVVFCDITSGYHGKYEFHPSLLASQFNWGKEPIRPNLMIHIGEVSGDYSMDVVLPDKLWRVSPDGELRDRFKRLSVVFEMEEITFFRHYAKGGQPRTAYLETCRKYHQEALAALPELPFSNVWIAQQSASRVPVGTTLHVGILNSLRCWNYFDLPQGVTTACNVGGFGIDGDVSTLIGASLVNPDKLYFAVVGDLAFFYDLNVLGNRHVGRNVRIMLINNGRGTEFHNSDHPASRFGEDGDHFMAAAGHFGNKSQELVKHYAQDLGYEYLTASNKEEYLANCDRFFNPEMTDRPMVFEVFTDSDDESDAIRLLRTSLTDGTGSIKQMARNLLGGKLTSKIGQIIRK
ncbi:MAG: 2-succinyl-5-enolpyruvyl-6-hydroxy-3-cyclohexene-1-carboxylate synthase [Muribaculaceae bacterium]|nr:2-succinyl-5-enolpyruvyl-6-hydroxy-3-cyclohexene-1-carboxylate synthase [Muribaculaceae bacterium]